MTARWFLAATLVAMPVAAYAQSLGLGLGLENARKKGGAGVSPFAVANGVYSLRKVVPAFAGTPIRLRRASDNAQQDIPFAGSDFDIAAATTFCNATSCFVAKWYDQSGIVQDWAQASAGSQPPLLFSCLGANPCLTFTSTAHQMSAPTASQATGVISYNATVNRAAGTGICQLIGLANNHLKTRSGVAGLQINGVSGSVVSGSADAAWHSATGVINGASSYLAVDGATTTGTTTGATASAAPFMAGAASTTCYLTELAMWGNYALTAAEADALNTDQHAYWGF